MNCKFIDFKIYQKVCHLIHFKYKSIEGDFLEFLLSERLPGYLLFPIVLSGLPTGYLLLLARWRLQKSDV